MRLDQLSLLAVKCFLVLVSAVTVQCPRPGEGFSGARIIHLHEFASLAASFLLTVHTLWLLLFFGIECS